MTDGKAKHDEKVGKGGLDMGRYTYDDATKLAWFWGQDISKAKARIRRKVKWGNEKILDNMLYEATGQYNWMVKSPFSMADAEALAEYWSCTPFQAKVAGGHKMSGWLVLNQALAEAPRDVDITTYVVVRGDTLTKIAKRFSTAEVTISASDIAKANSDTISDPDKIYAGQVLRIPSQPWGE